MSEPAPSFPFTDPASATHYLQTLAVRGEAPLPIGAAALALACLDRPGVDLARYHAHLETLAREVRDAAGGADAAGDRLGALLAVISDRHGYRGDNLTYDDLQNANLMRVIDRHKGLPVALGILYLHAGRAQGWDIAGLAFPGHFLLRLDGAGDLGILDPFSADRIEGAAGLRALLKSIGGEDRELSAEHYAAVSDREVLLRLQNNLKLRLLQSGRAEAALSVVESMLLLAPDRGALWHERGLINARLGNLGAAIRSLEGVLERERDSGVRFATAALLQELKNRLQ